MTRCSLIIFLFVIGVFKAHLFAQVSDVSRVNLGSVGESANQDSALGGMSADGRYLVFASKATNLTAASPGGFSQVYLRDTELNTTIMVSLSNSGVPGDGDSGVGSGDLLGMAISSNGRFVAFTSKATNLDGGDGNSIQDIYVYDVQQDRLARASVGLGGAIDPDHDCFNPSVSDDGRLVVFSTVSALETADLNGLSDIYLWRRPNVSATRISSRSAAESNGESTLPVINADGTFVAYASAASNLVDGDTNSVGDIFLYSIADGATQLLSKTSSGVDSNGSSASPTISSDGRYVGFLSLASNLIDSDTNSSSDLFLVDTQQSTLERVSINSDRRQLKGASKRAAISSDGRYIAFQSEASNAVDRDTNKTADIFVHDRQTQKTLRASLSFSGAQIANATNPFISTNGKLVAFESSDSSVVSGDSLSFVDIFVANLKQIVTPDLVIEDAPLVSVVSNTATIEMEQFSGASNKSAQAALSSAVLAQAAKRKPKKVSFRYEISLTGSGGAAGDVRKRLVKRNSYTFKKLRTGSYSANYKLVIFRRGKRSSATASSPTQGFSVG